jgi:hypothetical protein
LTEDGNCRDHWSRLVGTGGPTGITITPDPLSPVCSMKSMEDAVRD